MAEAATQAGIALTRVRDYCGIFRKMRVFLDGQKVGRFPYGTRAVFAAAPGEHDVYVQMDWCRSEPLGVSVESGQVIELECGCRLLNWRWLLNLVGVFAWPRRFFFVRLKHGPGV